MDLSKLPIKTGKRSSTIKPDEIFRGLTVRGTVENLWAPQAEALARWHEKRSATDASIEMTTGGGKTLVGLLIAQSLVNETRGKVLYVCPTNQLVEQTAARARECSLPVATYGSKTWHDQDMFDRCLGPCITNYDAVFNSMSTFRSHEVQAVVFDDSHVAHNRIRGQFTLKISRDSKTFKVFKPIADLFRPYFYGNHQSTTFDEILAKQSPNLLFVPMFEVIRRAKALSDRLVAGGVADEVSTKFAWGYLKDHIARCVIFISSSHIEITPYLLPVHELPYFGPKTRRVYLTATVPSQAEFIRTFGITKTEHIAPGGKSGEAQRQFLFMIGSGEEEQRATAKALIEPHKACIITPSEKASAAWCPPATRFKSEHGHEAIDAFRKASHNEKLALVARYDGIDLPGDSCRILVLDGMPLGETHLDRFMEQGLRIEALRAMRMSSRIIQALGRIFRSNNDHGAVVVCGTAVRKWMSDPNQQRFMPRLLQQQIQLGLELQDHVLGGRATFTDFLDGVLKGRPDWDTLYSDYVGTFDVTDRPTPEAWLLDLTARERKAFEDVWAGNFPAAAAEYAACAEVALAHDARYSAWLRHLAGWAFDLARNEPKAVAAYTMAARGRGELGRPPVDQARVALVAATKPSPQAERAAEIIFSGKRRVPDRIASVRKGLALGPDTNPAEQALAELGELLGLKASRPDKAGRKGPDVIWEYPEIKKAIGFEEKTDKKPSGNYDKDDIGQIHNHLQWMKEQYAGYDLSIALVGRLLPVTDSASPPHDLRVFALDQFVELLGRYEQMTQIVTATYKPADALAAVEIWLGELGLLWPSCFDALQSSLAVDLQNAPPE